MDKPARSQRKLEVTPEIAAAHAEWDREVEEMTEHSRKALLGDAVSVPDTIYSGLQEHGWYSADPVIDADPEVAKKAKSLLQLVKEFSVSPSGNWEMTLTDREIAAIGEERRWCTNCYSDQHAIDDDDWERRMKLLEGRIGPRPADAKPGVCCPICGGRLGIQGLIEAEELTGPDAFTPEQQQLVMEFFQGKFFPPDLDIDHEDGGPGDANSQ
jgi:hypothetical protein